MLYISHNPSSRDHDYNVAIDMEFPFSLQNFSNVVLFFSTFPFFHCIIFSLSSCSGSLPPLSYTKSQHFLYFSHHGEASGFLVPCGHSENDIFSRHHSFIKHLKDLNLIRTDSSLFFSFMSVLSNLVSFPNSFLALGIPQWHHLCHLTDCIIPSVASH